MLTMVSGLELTQNTGYDNGDGTVPQMGSLTPDIFNGVVVHRVRRDLSGLNVTLFQNFPGNLPQDFWTSITFSGSNYEGFQIFSADAAFLDNVGSAAWINMPDNGAFINGFTYELEWFVET